MDDLRPRIGVIGVGGAGSNAIDTMIHSQLEGVDFIVCNTDAQALQRSLSSKKIQLGLETTQGLGAGSKPDVGRASAEESLDEILEALDKVNMVFITAGMGGGTGTGGAPILAKAIREKGILTVGIVTKPFEFEGATRMRIANEGMEAMKDAVDTLLVIPNQNLFRLANQNTSVMEAFATADHVLFLAVRTFTDLICNPGLINLDFADISAVVRNRKGKAMMGTGEASGAPGEGRALEAAEKAIACPLLDNISISGAEALLINITGNTDITLYEVDEAASHVKEAVGNENANVILGTTIDTTLDQTLRVSVVATGIHDQTMPQKELVKNATQTPPSQETSTAKEELFEALGKLGSAHTTYDMPKETRPIHELRENTQDFDQDASSYSDPAPTTKRWGFFERFRARATKSHENAPSPEETLSPKNPDHGETSFEEQFFRHLDENKDLDVPAFLRKEKSSKK